MNSQIRNQHKGKKLKECAHVLRDFPAYSLQPEITHSPFYPSLPLNPLQTPHLTQPTQCSRKRKPFLVTTKDTTILQHLHVHTQIIHEIPHRRVKPLAVFALGDR